MSPLDKYYTFEGLSTRTFDIVLFGTGRLRRRYFNKHLKYREVIWYQGIKDLSKKLFIHNVKVLFTNDNEVLSTLRLKSSKYYPGCMEDVSKRLNNEAGFKGPRIAVTFQDAFGGKSGGG